MDLSKRQQQQKFKRLKSKSQKAGGKENTMKRIIDVTRMETRKNYLEEISNNLFNITMILSDMDERIGLTDEDENLDRIIRRKELKIDREISKLQTALSWINQNSNFIEEIEVKKDYDDTEECIEDLIDKILSEEEEA